MSHAGHGYRGGQGGGRRGRGAGFWGDAYYGDPPVRGLALDEKVIGLRQSVIATFAAARQVAQEGSPEKTAKATELLDETRKSLYRILVGETE